MASPVSLSVFGALGVAGVASGIYLGHAAIAEIDPIYFQEPPARFHGDLAPYRPSDSAPRPRLASADGELSLGTGCIGCRTYPEELYPTHSASIGRYATEHAEEAEPAETVEVEAAEDPERLRLRRDIDRVELYARGGEPEIVYASAEAPAPEPVQSEELPASE